MFIGIDHGTLAIRTAIIEANSEPITFALPRSNEPSSLLNELKKYVKLSSISLIGLTYSMGDAISQITPINLIKNRGVLSIEGVGKKTNVGTKIFDEVKRSGLPTVLIPGLHRNCDFLDERFRSLYSHHSSPSKVCAAYHCIKTLSKKIKIKNAVVSDISSSTSSILIKNEQIIGAVDACLGGPGLQYGPLDVEAIRRIDEGMGANEAFYGSFNGDQRLGSPA
jgi:putative methanogenesis marker protein 12